MKLIRCYIENFGKLQNFSYEFKDGLNVIKEENGFGKTTFATFIKSMFYGLDASKSESSERKKYKPWQGGNFGGNIEFEIERKKYKIERFFENKASDDVFKLYDLDTNLESKDYTENIGEEIFKINKNAYERSTYIPQGQIQIEMEDSLSAKLGNVLESENDINSSEKAINILSENMKIYKKIGKKGLLNEKNEELNKLTRELDETKFDETNLNERKERLQEKIKEIKEKEEQRKEKQKLLNIKIEEDRKVAKQETYSNIIKKLNENEEKYNKINEALKGKIPEDADLNSMLTKCIDLEKCKVEIENTKLSDEEKKKFEELNLTIGIKDEKNIGIQEIEQKISDCSKIAELEKELEKLKINKEGYKEKMQEQSINLKKGRLSKILATISIIAIVIGIALIFVVPKILGNTSSEPQILGKEEIIKICGDILVILGAIVGILSYLSGRKSKKEQIEYAKLKSQFDSINEEYNRIEQQKENLNSQIEELIYIFTNQRDFNNNQKLLLLTDIKAKINMYDDLKNKKLQKEEKANSLLVNKQNIENEIKQYLAQYFDDFNGGYSSMIQQLILTKNNLKTITEELEKSRKLKEQYEKTNNVEELNKASQTEKIDEVDEQKLNDEIRILGKEIDRLYDEKNQYKNQIEVLENKIDENSYIETDIENLKEEIGQMQEKYNILQKTKELLEKAKDSFSSHYLKGMVSEFEKNLNTLDDKELKTNVDINLDVKIDVNGSSREIKHFSAGYKDLIYICMRFSLIKALFEEELPFVILDDPFVNLDDLKTEKALNLVNEFAKKYQIIYFVCNSNRE